MIDRSKRRRVNYLYLFESEAAMHKALAMYDIQDDAATDIWAHTFKVPMFSEMTPFSYAIYVNRFNYRDNFRKAKWWDIGALAIWEVPLQDAAEDYKRVCLQTIKYVEGHPAIGGLQADTLFGHVTMVADPDAKPYRGPWVGDDRYEDRPDRPGISRFLKRYEDHVITNNQDIDEPLVIELTTLHSFELPREHQIFMFTAEGARMTELARYLNAIRLPAKQELWAGGVYLNKFHEELNGHFDDADIKKAELAPHLSKTEILEWAITYKNRHHVDCDDATLAEHVNQGNLQALFAALDKPKLFVREEWIASPIVMAYIVQDTATREWFLIRSERNKEAQTVERKLHLPDNGLFQYQCSPNVTINIPMHCDAERCYDEQDARYKLAKFYAAQLEINE